MLDHDADSYEKIAHAFLDGHPAGALTRERIVDNITLYWLTSSATSAARLYWESARAAFAAAAPAPPTTGRQMWRASGIVVAATRATSVMTIAACRSACWPVPAGTPVWQHGRSTHTDERVMHRDAAAMQRLEKSLTTYYSLVNRHMRDYYQHLDPARRVELEQWFLPEVPRRFIDKCVPWEANKRASEQWRKARTDVLRPLAITLIAIALERRKAAQRFITWFRAQVARAEAGQMALGEVLVYNDTEFDENRDALSVEDVRWVERPIQIKARVWTPASYIRWTRGERLYRNHFLRHVGPKRGEPRACRSLYDPTRDDRYVLELLSTPEDGLWFLPAAARQAFLTRMTARRGEPVIALHEKEFGDHPGLVSPAGSFGRWIGHSFSIRGGSRSSLRACTAACCTGQPCW